jgi:hypothetical protein
VSALEPEQVETEHQRLTRNWADLLQEIRVLQTGVQLLTGFLLTLPFQPQFGELDAATRHIYLATVLVSVAATAVIVTPVSIHRMVFRRHLRRPLVEVSHRLAQIGLVLLALALIGMVKVVFSIAVDPTAGWWAAGGVTGLFLALWVALPLLLRES